MAESHTISGDTHFGEIVIKEGYASPVQVQECLRIKSDLAEKGTPRQLGAIMVERGYLTIQQVEEILDKQAKRVLECPSCSGRFTVRGYEADKQYSCPRCGKLLASPPSEDGEPELLPIPEASAPRLDPENLVNQTVGGCKVLEKLAIGGMGTIYKARQLSMNRLVVVKTLSEDLAKDKAYVQRFLQEARAAGELSHTNLIHVMDVGYQDGVFYYIMEFIDGINLDTILAQKGKIPVDQAIDVIIQTARALEQAHARNIIHRDIKPDNIMITRDGVVKLADLGIAKKMSSDMGVTEPGMVLGTPFYMAPEQGRDSRRVDHRSDIYGLGATFYHMLSGNVPFDGKTTLEIVMKSIEEDPPPLKQVDPSLPDEVVAIIDKMMKKRPEDRYQAMAEVISDLIKVRDHQPLDWLPRKGPRSVTPPPVKAVPPRSSSGGTKKRVATPSPHPAVKQPAAQRTPITPTPVSKPASSPRLSAAKRKELGLDDSDLEDDDDVPAPAPQRPVAPGRMLPQKAAPAPPPTGKVSAILADSQGATPGKIYKERKRDLIWPIVTILGVAIAVFIAFKLLKGSSGKEGDNEGPGVVPSRGGSSGDTSHPEGFDNAFARKALEEADKFVTEFPADLDGQIDKYSQIVFGYPGTAQAAEAHKKMDERVKARNDAISKDYESVQAVIDSAEAKGAYAPATSALRDFGEKKIPKEWKEKVQAALKQIDDNADKRYEAISNEADELLNKGQLFAAIDKLGEAHRLGIERLTTKADGRLSDLEKKAYDQIDAAEARYHELRNVLNEAKKIKPLGELLWKLKVDEVKKRLEEIAADEGVRAVREEIQGDIADMDLVQKFIQSARDGVAQVKGQTFDIHHRSGTIGKSSPLKKMTIGPMHDDKIDCTQDGRPYTMEFLALTDDDIVMFALKSLPAEEAETKRVAGVYLLVMGEVDEAEKLLLDAISMGADVGNYLTKIEDARVRPRMPKEPTTLFYNPAGQPWVGDGGNWREDPTDRYLEGGELKGIYFWKPVDAAKPESKPEEYVLKARAKKVKGLNGFVLGFHAFGRDMRWNLGDNMNTVCWVEQGKVGVPGTRRDEGVEEGRWYSLRLVVTRDFVVAYVNNKRQWRIGPSDVAKAEQGMPPPGIGVGVVATRAYFRDIILWPLAPK